ncbi:RNA polymerase sigma factor [Actinokineospora iranica]|uniref:RNA polymerase sigma-70 factor, ECF subfamily n=1 Tax=Actinokineospora iranica TaxID=1271860 RepID=A0A1G6MEG3_9PSEU|nr:RNA polymerase sigma factor [Actinokineospora iranica]SDC53889.1 RNA polymerase sigma-70 factor, ECF subfamily [Actinokineospora iranica]
MGSDEQLIGAIARGDQDALRALYARHATGMLRLLHRLTSNAAVAEEVLQETWLAVWQSAGGFRGESSVRSWLFGVCRRQAHNRLRRSAFVEVDLAEVAEPPDPDPAVEDQVLARADHEALVSAIDELPEHLRAALALVLTEEMTYPEVAEALGVPVGTVKSRMSHARRRLALALASVKAQEGGTP